MSYVKLFDGPQLGHHIFAQEEDTDFVITGNDPSDVATKVTDKVDSLGVGSIVADVRAQQALVPGMGGTSTILDYAHVVYREMREY